MSKGESRARNICRIGCGRPVQGDYGWRGPAFNCCFGTVACLVEHKRLVRHASMPRTCEYLPEQWNAPLSPRLPYEPPILTLHIHCTSNLLVLLTWWGTGRHTHIKWVCNLHSKACWELFSNSCSALLCYFCSGFSHYSDVTTKRETFSSSCPLSPD